MKTFPFGILKLSFQMHFAVVSIIYAMQLNFVHGAFENLPADAQSRAAGMARMAEYTSGNAIYLNPALLPYHSGKASIASTFAAQMTGLENGNILNITLNAVIPIRSNMAAAASYSGQLINVNGVNDPIAMYGEYNIAGAFAMKLGKIFSAGTTVMLQRYLINDEIIGGVNEPFVFNGHLGASAVLPAGVKAALVFQNLYGTSVAEVNAPSKEYLPRYIKLALAWNKKGFFAESGADAAMNKKQFNWRIGIGKKIILKNAALNFAGGFEMIDGGLGLKPSAGAGLETSHLTAAYAWAYAAGAGSAGDHLFTLGVRF